MKFEQFLNLNENIYAAEAEVEEFMVTFIDEDADESTAIKTINTCLNALSDLGVMVHDTKDKGGQRSYNKVTIDTSLVDDLSAVARAMRKALNKVDNKVAFEGDIKYDGHALNITYDENDDYTSAVTHFK